MTALLHRPQLALAALCLLLATLLVYELENPPPEPAVPVLAWRTVDGSQPLPLTRPFPALERYAAIDARPVFNPARKPVEAAGDKANAAAALPPPTDIALVGVIIQGEHRLALIRSATAAIGTTATVGSQLAGWQVTAIESDHMVLHAGTADYTIVLSAGRAAPGHGAASAPQPLPTSPPAAPAGGTP